MGKIKGIFGPGLVSGEIVIVVAGKLGEGKAILCGTQITRWGYKVVHLTGDNTNETHQEQDTGEIPV